MANPLALTYIVPLLRLPETNVLRSQSHNVALGVDDASTGTTRPNVNSDEMIEVRGTLLRRTVLR